MPFSTTSTAPRIIHSSFTKTQLLSCSSSETVQEYNTYFNSDGSCAPPLSGCVPTSMISFTFGSLLLPRSSTSSTIYHRTPNTLKHYATFKNNRQPQSRGPRITAPPNTSTPRPRRSRVPLYLGGALFYGISIYLGSSLYHIYNTAPPDATTLDESLTTSKPEVYDRIARTYDADIGLDESLMGLTWLRWSIVRHLSGDIMEVSSGTGRNLPYYDPSRITSLTCVDQSFEMQDIARRKMSEMGAAWAGKKVTFKDVAVEGLSNVRETYDVVLQSFGLCSVSDPVGYLSHLARFCRDDGVIVLLEHGRGKYAWINRILDATVHRHAEKWGCFYNRDIAGIVEECEDVEVVSCQRWHFGTTYVYYLKPK